MEEEQETTWWAEGKAIFKLALPSMLAGTLSASMNLTDVIFVGHIDKDALAAAAVGNAFYNLVMYPTMGVLTALDTLTSNAYGARNFVQFRHWTRVCFVVMLVIGAIGSVLLWFSEWFIEKMFDQPHDIIRLSGQFAKLLIPGYWMWIFFSILQKSLQSQNVMKPLVWISFLANLINVGGNFGFIWGLGLGFQGAPIATSTSRGVMFICALIYVTIRDRRAGPEYILFSNHHENPSLQVNSEYEEESNETNTESQPLLASSDRKFSWSSSLKTFLSLGLPGGLMLGAEASSIEASNIFASRLGSNALMGHTIMRSLGSFIYVSIPFAVAVAITVRVGNLVGANKPKAARLSAKVSLIIGGATNTFIAVLLLITGHWIGHLFTNNPDVIAVTRKLVIVMALVLTSDGIQGCAQGVLKAVGKQNIVAVLNLVALWGVGVPIGYALAFPLKFGLPGLWWSFVIGMASIAIVFTTVILCLNWEKEALASQKRQAASSRNN
eukprot:m.344460 g.344460  ORF g.344460 m.344460 type:complete len:496 (+) comp24489_c0_seq1:144-1631(+)